MASNPSAETLKTPNQKMAKKDFYALKLHGNFDQIDMIMEQKVYATEQQKQAVQLLKCARHFIMLAFVGSYAE